MDSYHLRLVTALCLMAPLTFVACGDDDGDDHDHTTDEKDSGKPDSGKAGSGPSAGMGGRAGSSPAGSGGSKADSGAADASVDSGTDSGAPPPECDLSGEGKEEADVPNPTGTTTLTKDKVWKLEGLAYVEDGDVLTIEPCTRIVGVAGDPPGTIIVSRGGKIMAEGTKDEPILFTSELEPGSRGAGDWGGVILLGKAPNFSGDETLIEGLADAPENHHGGSDPEDNSGVMTYVRLEFGGYELMPGNEINGLTMGSVGSETVINHIMVNTSKDDCFEWFGGTVSAKYLICNNAGDDMFDADTGFTGTLEFLFGRQNAISSSDPNGFEMDSSLNDLTPVTNVKASHVTLCGTGEMLTSVNHGMVLREKVTGTFDDIVVTGFDDAVDTRDTFGTPADPNVTIANSLFFDGRVADVSPASETDNDMGFSEIDWFEMGDGNEVPDPAPFTVEDCQAEDGPNDAVKDSEVGAFADGAAWMDGLWVDWSIE